MNALAPRGVEGRPAAAPPLPAAATVAKLSGALAALSIVTYQSWFMPYFQSFFAGREGLAGLVFYALYGSILAATGAVLATRADLRRKILPFAVAAALGLAAVMLHPVGLVTRAYIIAVALGGATALLLLASAPVALLRLSASVIALNAAICLSDLLLPEGYSNVAGRAAGLALNANGAAAALVLGTAAAYRAVPGRLRPSFFVLVGAALFATFSRSTILAAVAAIAVAAAVATWRGRRAGRRFRFPRPAGLLPAALLAMGLVAWLGLAFAVNGGLRGYFLATTGDFFSAGTALHEAQDAIGDTIAQSSPASPAAAGPATADSTEIAAISTRLMGEGGRNTISARTLFLQRALLAYRNNGFFGSGLEAAQGLVPHNSFVLFALAYGHLGWLIPLAVVGFCFYPARDAGDLPLGVAAIGVMLTSHDILLNPSLFLPLALGIAGMIAGRQEARTAACTYRSIAFGTAAGAALFVAGCFAVILCSPGFAEERLRAEDMRPFGEGYTAPIEPPAFAGIFRSASGLGPEDGGRLRLAEDSSALVRDDGLARSALPPGHYRILAPAVLLFAASDGSDPRGNGRVYTFAHPIPVSPLFYGLLGLIAAWCAAMTMTLWHAGREST